ncbi:DUF3853 family protein [uncultured Chryseobacterium sp.]|uniref:DUF3853 family protein n=1 Tax=uncultured Chryseobacterium sp. TaxID=259322 RepID=UPI00261A2177|nr:DUF3853 family protein [uncultured Chryseobacterium sp.]
METQNLLTKPLWQMTGEEFLALTNSKEKEKIANQTGPPIIKENKKLVYGIRGIANLFDCSIATANRIKKSGVIDDAIFQRNRTIVVDAEIALQLFKSNNKEISTKEN